MVMIMIIKKLMKMVEEKSFEYRKGMAAERKEKFLNKLFKPVFSFFLGNYLIFQCSFSNIYL